jgi:hypothetical protein
MLAQYFTNQQSATLVWTRAEGSLAAPFSDNVRVYLEGQLLNPDTVPPAYTITPNAAPGQSWITIDAGLHFAGNNYIVFANAGAGAGASPGLSCLDLLVGLSPEECPCFDEAPPSFSYSASGYYIADAEHGYPLKPAALANAPCWENSIWEALSNAREQAVRDLKQDLLAALRREKVTEFRGWRGTVGEVASNARNFTGRRTYSGLLLRPTARLVDQSFVVTAVWAGFDFTGVLNATIESNAPGWVPENLALNTVAGKFTRNALASPIALPMYDLAHPGIAYAFAYDPTQGSALDNRAHCGCGGKPGWMRSLDVSGFDSDEIPAREGEPYVKIKCDSRLHGLALEGYFACESLDFLCRLPELGGADTLSLLGRALQYKAAIKLFERDATSGQVNQGTLLNAEGRAARVRMYQESYFNIIQFAVMSAPAGASSCWGCGRNQPRVATAAL